MSYVLFVVFVLSKLYLDSNASCTSECSSNTLESYIPCGAEDLELDIFVGVVVLMRVLHCFTYASANTNLLCDGF